MSSLPDPQVLAAELRALGFDLPSGPLRVDGYGDSPELSESLLALIREGRKRAGTGLAWAMQADGESMPQVGDIEIVIDHAHRPVLVTRLTRVRQCRYDEVDAEYAAIEGEGDGSLEHWRRAHWNFFSRESRRIGRQAEPGMPVVCSVFELLHSVPLPSTQSRLRIYAAVWNEPDRAAREHLVPLCLHDDAVIIGPGYRLRGQREVLDEIARFHREDPGFRPLLASGFDVHSGWARFAFVLLDPAGRQVNEGWDLVEFAPDGRIGRVVSFWGALPSPP